MPGGSRSFGFPPFATFPSPQGQLPSHLIFPNSFMPVTAFTDGQSSYDVRVWFASLGYSWEENASKLAKHILLLVFEAGKRRLRVNLPAYQQWWLDHHGEADTLEGMVLEPPEESEQQAEITDSE